jgi:hypothetical protein
VTCYRILAKPQSIAQWLDANTPFDWEAVSIVDKKSKCRCEVFTAFMQVDDAAFVLPPNTRAFGWPRRLPCCG